MLNVHSAASSFDSSVSAFKGNNDELAWIKYFHFQIDGLNQFCGLNALSVLLYTIVVATQKETPVYQSTENTMTDN